MSTGGHSHGDPSLECTITDCRYPDVRFLCGARHRVWRAGMINGLCVLPKEHRGSSLHMDEFGYEFSDLKCVPNDLDSLRRYAERVSQESGAATVLVAVGTGPPIEFVVPAERLSDYTDLTTGALVEALKSHALNLSLTAWAG